MLADSLEKKKILATKFCLPQYLLFVNIIITITMVSCFL